jgi:SAM-dependent methyltransferase
MTSIEERYDLSAEDYGRYWAPVLDAVSRRLLGRIDDLVLGLGRRGTVLDIGTGHGILASEARRRWPEARIIGADASAGMLAVARRQHGGGDEPDAQLRWIHAPADVLPLPDRSVDAILSSFVYQLVPDRRRAFEEALRVLRPGGRLALVTWIDSRDEFEPDVEFDEAVYDLDIEDPQSPEQPLHAGDFRSARSAARELRDAGFRRVSAAEEMLDYSWTLESYLDFKQNYDERSLFASLESDAAGRLLERVRERYAELPADAFRWRAKVVSAVGQRPG